MFETGVDEMSWDDTVGCIFIFICFVIVSFGTYDLRSTSIHAEYAKQHRRDDFQHLEKDTMHHITSSARNTKPTLSVGAS